MGHPFAVDTGELREHAGIVRNASSTAGAALGATRGVAASAAPGYPGDAAAPFEEMMSRFADFDGLLERTGHRTADRLEDSAGMYDKTEDIVEGIFDGIIGIGRAVEHAVARGVT